MCFCENFSTLHFWYTRGSGGGGGGGICGQCVHLEHKEVGAGEKVGRPSCTEVVKPTSVCEFVLIAQSSPLNGYFQGIHTNISHFGHNKSLLNELKVFNS